MPISCIRFPLFSLRAGVRQRLGCSPLLEAAPASTATSPCLMHYNPGNTKTARSSISVRTPQTVCSTPRTIAESAYEADRETLTDPSTWKHRARKCRHTSTGPGRTLRHRFRHATLGGADFDASAQTLFLLDTSTPTQGRRSRRSQSLAMPSSDATLRNTSIINTSTHPTLVGLGLGIHTIHIQEIPRRTMAVTDYRAFFTTPRLRSSLVPKHDVISPIDGLPSPVLTPSACVRTPGLPTPFARRAGLGFALPRCTGARAYLDDPSAPPKKPTLGSPFKLSTSPPWAFASISAIHMLVADKPSSRKVAVGLGFGLPRVSPQHTPHVGSMETLRSDAQGSSKAPMRPRLVAVRGGTLEMSPVSALSSPVLAHSHPLKIPVTFARGDEADPQVLACPPAPLRRRGFLPELQGIANANDGIPDSLVGRPTPRAFCRDVVMSPSSIRQQLVPPLVVQSLQMFTPLLVCASSRSGSLSGSLVLSVGLSPRCGLVL